MSLHFIQLGKLRDLIDVNGTWLAFLTRSSDQSLLVIGKDSLRKNDSGIETIFRVFTVPNLLVITNDIGLKWSPWKVHN